MYAAAKAILHVYSCKNFTLTGSMRQSLPLMSNLHTAEELHTTSPHKWQSSSTAAVNTGLFFICLDRVLAAPLRCMYIVGVWTCQSHLLHFHPSTFSDIAAAGSSLKVVDEHRHTVGPHQVVGVSREGLVLPAFWVTCTQTDGIRGGGVDEWVIAAAPHKDFLFLYNRVTQRQNRLQNLVVPADFAVQSIKLICNFIGCPKSLGGDKPSVTVRSKCEWNNKHSGLCHGESSSDRSEDGALLHMWAAAVLKPINTFQTQPKKAKHLQS